MVCNNCQNEMMDFGQTKICLQCGNEVKEGEGTIHPFLLRAFLFLNEGAFVKADEYCDRVLDEEPFSAYAYLCKLMVKLKIKNVSEFSQQTRSFKEESFFQKAYNYGDDAMKERLLQYHAQMEKNAAKIRFDRAKEIMENASTVEDWDNALYWLDAAEKYGVTDAQLQSLVEESQNQKALYVQAEDNYRRGLECMENEWESYLTIAIEYFEAAVGIIPNYKDCEQQIAYCRERIEEDKKLEQALRNVNTLMIRAKNEQEWNDLVTVLENLHEIAPNNEEVVRCLNHCRMKLEILTEAREQPVFEEEPVETFIEEEHTIELYREEKVEATSGHVLKKKKSFGYYAMMTGSIFLCAINFILCIVFLVLSAISPSGKVLVCLIEVAVMSFMFCHINWHYDLKSRGYNVPSICGNMMVIFSELAFIYLTFALIEFMEMLAATVVFGIAAVCSALAYYSKVNISCPFASLFYCKDGVKKKIRKPYIGVAISAIIVLIIFIESLVIKSRPVHDAINVYLIYWIIMFGIMIGIKNYYNREQADKHIRPTLSGWALACFIMFDTAMYALSDDASMLGGSIFFLGFGAILYVLSLSPKYSPYLFGKTQGVKKSVFVVIGIIVTYLLAFIFLGDV